MNLSYFTFGFCRYSENNYTEAISYFNEFPNKFSYTEAVSYLSRFNGLLDTVHFYVGNSYFSQNNLIQAEREYREAIRIKPDDTKANYNLKLLKIKLQEEENKKRREEIKKIKQIYNSLDPLQQEEIRIETENRLPDFWKENINRGRVRRTTSKMLEVVLEEKRIEIIKEWIDSGRIKT